MKTLTQFNYVRPQAIAEVTELLAKYKEKALIFAGGTDLLVMMKDRIITPEYIIDIKSIPDLNRVTWDEKGGLKIGALTKISTLVNSDVIKRKFASLHEAAKLLGTHQLRNMATIGGNICRSSPSADLIPPLLVFDARLKLVGPESERTVALDDFITGPGINVLNNEILTEIIVAPEKQSNGTSFIKLGRLSEDLAKVNCAAKISVTDGKFNDVRIALGAVGPKPVRARGIESALEGKEISTEVIERAVKKVIQDISPITDVRSSAEYRTRVSQILVKRVINEALKRLEN